MSTGVSGVSLDRNLAIDRRLDGQFAPEPVINGGQFSYYGDLARNTNFTKAMGIDEDDLKEVLAGKTEHLAIATALMASSLRGDEATKDLKEIYNRDEFALAQELYIAEKMKAKQQNLDKLLATAAGTAPGQKLLKRDKGGSRFKGINPIGTDGKELGSE